MYKETDFIIFIYYCLEKEIISFKEVIQSVDNKILKEKNTPYYFTTLSLAKSLGEFYFILDDIVPRSSLNFKYLDGKYVLTQLYNAYKSKQKDIHQIIILIFHIKDDIDLDEDLLNDIYVIDNDRDLYLSNMIELSDLEARLDFFFKKYYVPSTNILYSDNISE